MTKRPLRNVPHSVHQRLLDKARETHRPFSELLQYYAMERFLYRLCRSPYADTFMLKGALMLVVWRSPLTRPTMDIDLLGRMDNTVDAVAGAVRDICVQEVEEPDGLEFAADPVRADPITEDADYSGVRVRFECRLGNARVPMQVDVGFGDPVSGSQDKTEYPTILDMPAPHVRGYSRESATAEKLHAMVKRGETNSRMRDFYDIWLLSRQFAFSGNALSDAIRRTFAARSTEIPALPAAFTDAFAGNEDRRAMWRGFRRRSRIDEGPRELTQVVAAVAAFLGPVVRALSAGEPFCLAWPAGGPWR